MTGRFGASRPYTADAVGAVQSKTRRRLRMLALALPVVLMGALLLSPAAFAGWFLPESGGSPNAEGIRTLYILIALLALVIFIGVEGLLVYSMFKYRARKGRVAAQIHGNTQLEIGWTVGAAAILIFLTVFTFLLLDDIKNPAASQIDANGNQVSAGTLYASTDQPPPPGGARDALTIDVVGQQYAWEFKYPDNGDRQVYSWNDMYVPIGRTVVLNIRSVDVAHSWWIPPLGGKMDAIPGYTNHSWFQVPLDQQKGDQPLVYEGQCAELCGRNHADMLARVIALPFDEWKAWYDRKADELEQAKQEAADERERLNAQEGQ
jgi:cytochrome c oxidase subunit II